MSAFVRPILPLFDGRLARLSALSVFLWSAVAHLLWGIVDHKIFVPSLSQHPHQSNILPVWVLLTLFLMLCRTDSAARAGMLAGAVATVGVFIQQLLTWYLVVSRGRGFVSFTSHGVAIDHVAVPAAVGLTAALLSGGAVAAVHRLRSTPRSAAA